MEKSESITNLVAATLKVMAEVKGIEKNLTVGEGKNSYSGVADKDVKQAVGEAMQRNGLTIFCTDIEEKTDVSLWDEVDQWSKSTPKDIKRKQSVFTKVITSYMLCHESGEYVTLKGFGHGVDSQDKSAGKATTYALKYALLYTFLIPTGKIDDADNTHSDAIPVPQKTPQPKTPTLSPELDKLLTQSIATLEGVESMEVLKTIWNELPELQKVKQFIDAVNEVKTKLSKKV